MALGLFGAPARVAQVHQYDQRDHGDAREDQGPEHDEVGGALAEFLLIGVGKFLRGGEQRLGVVHDLAAGLLRVHQRLKVSENRGHRPLEFLVGLFKFGKLCLLLRVLRCSDAKDVIALHQALQQLAEGGGVLAHQKRHLRVDHVGTEHGIRVPREALRQHHQLP